MNQAKKRPARSVQDCGMKGCRRNVGGNGGGGYCGLHYDRLNACQRLRGFELAAWVSAGGPTATKMARLIEVARAGLTAAGDEILVSRFQVGVPKGVDVLELSVRGRTLRVCAPGGEVIWSAPLWTMMGVDRKACVELVESLNAEAVTA